MKRILLGLEACLVVSLSTCVVVSCSNHSNQPTKNINFIINTKPIEQKNIVDDLEILSYKLSLNVLCRLFDHIDSEIYDHITTLVIQNKVTNQAMVILQADDGFTIDEQKALDSRVFNLTHITNFVVSAKPKETINIFDSELKKDMSLETLNKIFIGFSKDLYEHSNISLNLNEEAQKATITITARIGYVINGQKVLQSETFKFKKIIHDFKIIAKESQDIKDISIDEFSSQTLSMETLNKIFDGITNEVYVYLIMSINKNPNTNQTRVILSPREGYTINQKQSLDSSWFNININITQKNQSDKIVDNELQVDLISLNTLKKLFVGLDSNNFKYLKASYNNVYDKNFITLEAHDGYTINNSGGDKFQSLPFLITITDIAIQVHPHLNLENVIGEISFDTLKKVFIGLKGNNLVLNHLQKATYNQNLRQITLTTQTGYLFDNRSLALNSNSITLNINANSKKSIRTSYFSNIFPKDPSTKLSEELLNIFFDGITNDNYSFIHTLYNKDPKTYNTVIIISLSNGYIFNNIPHNNSIASNSFIMVDLIKPPTLEDINKNIFQQTAQDFFDNSKNKSTSELRSIIFKNPNPTELNDDNNITINLKVIDNSKGILSINFILNNKFDFTPGINFTPGISNEYKLVLTDFLSTNLKTSLIDNPTVNYEELLYNIDFKTITNVYGNIKENTFADNHFNCATFNLSTRIMTLFAQDGFLFENQTNKLDSNPITVNFRIGLNDIKEKFPWNQIFRDKLSLETLNKFFKTLTPQVYYQYCSVNVVHFGLLQYTHILELRTFTGYTINSVSELNSKSFVVIPESSNSQLLTQNTNNKNEFLQFNDRKQKH